MNAARFQNNVGAKPGIFKFRSKMPPLNRMPFNHRPQAAMSVSKVLSTPIITNNRSHNKQFPQMTFQYEDGYASAIEPMDCDDWGAEEDFWMEDNQYEQEVVTPMKRKSLYSQLTRGNPVQKVLRSSFASNIKDAQYREQQRLSDENKPLRQSVLNMDNSKGLSFKLEQKPKRNVTFALPEINGRKLFPKWGGSSETRESKMILDDKGQTFPRIFTVTIEKLQQWPKILSGSKILFELYGILETATDGKYPGSKEIVLKGEKKRDNLTCIFYEIDRKLPAVEKGQWHRCIVLWRSNNEFQCLKIRSASCNELRSLDMMVTKSSKSKAILLKSLND